MDNKASSPTLAALKQIVPSMIIWLDVPYQDKDRAKVAGARWDQAAKRWFAPQPGMVGLAEWEAAPDIPDLLPGENRTFGQGLFVDLVPSSCWFTNVRSCVAPRDWERLRHMIEDRAGRRCEVCGAGKDRAKKRWLEAHERWAYDDRVRVQSLRRLICLCTDCHHVTHFGFASQVLGIGEQALAHLVHVTGMSKAEAYRHVDEAFTLWHRRSQVEWDLDLSILTGAGITSTPQPKATDRSRVAEATLRQVR